MATLSREVGFITTGFFLRASGAPHSVYDARTIWSPDQPVAGTVLGLSARTSRAYQGGALVWFLAGGVRSRGEAEGMSTACQFFILTIFQQRCAFDCGIPCCRGFVRRQGAGSGKSDSDAAIEAEIRIDGIDSFVTSGEHFGDYYR